MTEFIWDKSDHLVNLKYIEYFELVKFDLEGVWQIRYESKTIAGCIEEFKTGVEAFEYLTEILGKHII